MRAISYSRVREKKERDEDVWSLKKERDITKKICYKTAIHGKNITVQEKKEKKKKCDDAERIRLESRLMRVLLN